MQDDYERLYVTAIYFVTTTLSTCGFGDFSATLGNPIEAGVILFLQFTGMLLYSMTIQKVQSFMINDLILPADFANNMVELVENLIVKVGKKENLILRIGNQKSAEGDKISGEIIRDWKMYTLRFFKHSTCSYLQENKFYQSMSENMKVKIVKDNLKLEFQEKFDILFFDAEFGFKAGDKLITMIVSSLALEYIFLKESVIPVGCVSRAIYCIDQGKIQVYSKDSSNSLLTFEPGSYFGEISFIFKIINQYRFI